MITRLRWNQYIIENELLDILIDSSKSYLIINASVNQLQLKAR